MLGPALPPGAARSRALLGPALRTCPPHATASPAHALAALRDTPPPGRLRGSRRRWCWTAWAGRAAATVPWMMLRWVGIWGGEGGCPASATVYCMELPMAAGARLQALAQLVTSPLSGCAWGLNSRELSSAQGQGAG